MHLLYNDFDKNAKNTFLQSMHYIQTFYQLTNATFQKNHFHWFPFFLLYAKKKNISSITEFFAKNWLVFLILL